MFDHLKTYKNAIAKGKEIEFYNNRENIGDVDSYYYHLNDMAVLWEHAVIPLYEEGDHEVPERIKSYIKQILETETDLLAISCAIYCMVMYERLHIFLKFPFEIDFSECKQLAKEAVIRNETAFKNYHGDGFEPFEGSAYDFVARMVGL